MNSMGSKGETSDAVSPTSGLFTRKSSGLVRELGFRDTFAISVAILAPNLAFVLYTVGLIFFPGVDLTWPLIIAAVASVFLGLVYAQLVSTLPRSGGDYVYASRIVSPLAGALVGGAVFIVFFTSAANAALIFGQQYLPFMCEAWGDALGISGLENLGGDLAEQTPAMIAGIVMLLLFGLIASRGARATARTVFWMFGIGLVGMLATLVLFLTHDTETFRAAFGSAAENPNAYEQVLTAAHGAGLDTSISFAALLSATPLMIVGYIGFTFGIFPGAEIKRPSRTAQPAILAALGVGAVALVACWLALKGLAGRDFLQSAAWLSANDPETYERITGGAPVGGQYYALLVAGDPVSKLLIGIGFPLAVMANGLPFILIHSRVTFALSFDRLLPASVSKINPKTHSPTVAILIAMAGSVLFTVLATYTSFLTLFRNTTLIYISIFLIASIVACVLPYRRKELYAASPKMFSGPWLGIPPITWIGGISAIIYATLLYLGATEPAISGGYEWDSLLTLSVVVLFGPSLYFGARFLNRTRRGLDLDLAMRELPPD